MTEVVMCEECGERPVHVYVARAVGPNSLCYSCWSKTPVSPEEDAAFQERMEAGKHGGEVQRTGPS